MNIVLGTTLQINPSGTLPVKNKKFDGKFVICNLQPTKYDKKADLVISTYVDVVMEKVAKRLGIEILEYSADTDPTKLHLCTMEWTIPNKWMKEISSILSEKSKLAKKRKAELADKFEDENEKLTKTLVKKKGE